MTRIILIVLAACHWALSPVAAGDLERARSLIDQRKYGEAEEVIFGVIDRPVLRGECLVLLTRICNDLMRYEDAVGFAEQAVRLSPDSSEAHQRYAEALRLKLSSVGVGEALSLLEPYNGALRKALDLNPENVGALEEEIGWLLFAPGFAGGDIEAARSRIDALEPLDRRRSMKWRARAAFKAGDDQAGRRILAELLERYPDDHEARLDLGLKLQASKSYRRADEQFALAARGTDPVYALAALYQRARTRILGRFEPDLAVSFLLEFTSRLDGRLPGVPGKSAAYRRLGEAYEQLGKIGEARDAYRRALSLDAENAKAREALAALPAG